MTRPLLKQHYDGYYSHEITEWRTVGAVGKAANIINSVERVRPAKQPFRVIELGCGDGAVIDALRSSTGWDVVGADVSTTGVAAARERGLAVELFDGVMTAHPDNSFDLAVMTHVLEHVEDPRSLIREARRLASLVFVEVPTELNARLSHDFVWTSLGHINVYDARTIRHLLQSTGLRVRDEFSTNPSRDLHRLNRGWRGAYILWPVRQVALRVVPGLATRLFTYHRSLLAERDGSAYSESAAP